MRQEPPCISRRVADRQLAAVAALAQEALRHLVEERAALQGVEAPALLRLERRLEAQHVLQQVLEAAAGEGGETAGRDRGLALQGVEAAP